jgi:hypothetical protein
MFKEALSDRDNSQISSGLNAACTNYLVRSLKDEQTLHPSWYKELPYPKIKLTQTTTWKNLIRLL